MALSFSGLAEHGPNLALIEYIYAQMRTRKCILVPVIGQRPFPEHQTNPKYGPYEIQKMFPFTRKCF